MRIVHIVMSMLYGGSERLATDLAYSMQEHNNEVHVIALKAQNPDKGYDKTEKGLSLTIHYIDKKQGFDYKAISELNRLLTKLSPDVVHTHIDSAIYVMPWIAIHPNVIKIHTVHNQAEKEFGILKRKIMKAGYRLFNITPVAISDLIKKSILLEYGISEERVPVIYNGIDVSRFKPVKRKETSRTLQILHVGRFFPQKNHDFMIQAVSEMVQKGLDFHVTFVGEGPLFDEMVRKVHELGISSYITFAGTTNFISDYYSAADIFILPSIFEGLPLSLLEAYAAELPVIASNVGGVSDICENHKNGYLIEPNNMDQFINAVISLIDQSHRKKYSEYNAEYIKNYDVDVVACRYLKLYKEISSGRRHKF